MKFNPKLKNEIQKFYDYVIIVEGKKQIEFLNSINFPRVIEIHITGKTIEERVSEIIDQYGKDEKYCILTSLDKKGKLLYFKIKETFESQGVKPDSELRSFLLLANIQDISQMKAFFSKANKF